MRILFALLGASVLAGASAPASAQTVKPAVVGASTSPLETLWRVRVALNVAALGCHDADEVRTVAAYNVLLKRHAAMLAVADDAVGERYKAQYGATWQNARDRDVTKLSTFFAQPSAQSDFCRTAKVTLALIASADSASLLTVAADELVALQEPFWSPLPQNQFAAGTAPGPVVAASAAVPVAPSGF